MNTDSKVKRFVMNEKDMKVMIVDASKTFVDEKMRKTSLHT